ncbi:MAG: hypothetical protein ACK4NY_23240 [Spirosomataceae bacterium]
MIYILLFILLAIQIWAVVRQKALPKLRFRVKLLLNLLLWIVLFLFVYQPEWKSTADTSKVLIVGENVETSRTKQIQDSLKITETFSLNEFKKKTKENPTFVENLGNVYLIGEGFNSLILSKFSAKNMTWIPNFRPNQLQSINWQGVLRKGQIQEVKGKIETADKQVLRVKFGKQVLDSTVLNKGLNEFTLRFPTFAIGRTETGLFLGDDLLKNIQFFTYKPQSLSVLFVLDNPDFESKNLADWLGKNGHRVEIQTTIAKNTKSQGSINKTKEKFEPDLVITDASNAANKAAKKAVSDGNSVLFIGFVNPDVEIKQINQALGTRWILKKISNQENIKISDELTALPFQFIPNPTQKTLADYPISIHRTTFKAGVSLLNETFPIKLSGDSLNYSKIWNSVIDQLIPPQKNNVLIDAPVYQDVQNQVFINNSTEDLPKLIIEKDTVTIQKSGVNAATLVANYRFRDAGWQPLADSMEIYVESKDSQLAQAKEMQEFVNAKSENQLLNSSENQQIISKIPDWTWFLLIIVCLSLLWIEPKLRF